MVRLDEDDPDRHRAALESLTERGKQETRERLAALEETDG